jgi:hypothetical protein
VCVRARRAGGGARVCVYVHAQARSGRTSAKRENECEAREYMNGTWRRSRREREAQVCGACSTHLA